MAVTYTLSVGTRLVVADALRTALVQSRSQRKTCVDLGMAEEVAFWTLRAKGLVEALEALDMEYLARDLLDTHSTEER